MSMSGDVVRFNVGGAPIEIARETLDAYPQSLIRGLALACPAGAEVFIDREAAGLRTIVDYLHCGARVVYEECSTPARAEFLEREAEFYGFVDVAQKCGLLYAFRPRCEVSWRPDAIDNYCALFAKCIVDPALVIPFTYERNSHIVARCIACEESHEPRASHVFVFSLTEWSALRSHMQHIVGIVEKLIGNSCCLVRWTNGVTTHLPKTALRCVIDDL